MKKVALILAVDEKNGIGKNNDLAWRIKADMLYFKDITTATQNENKQNAVIMGRKTWESIPEKFRPLPKRKNIVLSRQYFDETLSFTSIESALAELEKNDEVENIFIIGGAQIYNETVKKWLADTIYLTQVFGDFDCDSFFIWIPEDFSCTYKSEKKEEKGIEFVFEIFEKA